MKTIVKQHLRKGKVVKQHIRKVVQHVKSSSPVNPDGTLKSKTFWDKMLTNQNADTKRGKAYKLIKGHIIKGKIPRKYQWLLIKLRNGQLKFETSTER